MSALTDALEAWRQAEREFKATTTWTAPWVRTRLVEEERRLAFHAALREMPDEVDESEYRVDAPAYVKELA